MNFDAWQSQQKVQKDEERKRKSQAAEALRNYRSEGLSEEEMKLAAIREQERKQKEEAERQLRGYRGTLSEEELKLAALKEEERRKKLEAEQKLRGYGLVDGTQQDGPSQAIAPGAVSAMAGKFSGSGQTVGMATPHNALGSAPSLESTPGGEIASPPDAFADQSPAQLWTETPVQPKLNPPQFSPVKFDAAFVFGLISAEESPSLDGYLPEVDRIIRSAVGDELTQTITFEYPLVKAIEKDATFMDPAGRFDVTRKMVTISVPFVVNDEKVGRDVTTKIVESMRLAIRNGSFKKQN